MITLFGASLMISACIAGPVSPSRGAGTPFLNDSTHRELFERGVTFTEFLKRASARKEQWDRNYAAAAAPDALVARARAVGGSWKLLVVAVDGCSDSVNTIPYLARLAEQVPGIELRIVNSELGRSVMNAHRTPDGRAATPTIVLLDSNYEERGCWVERPADLQRWMIDNKGKVKDSELVDHKMAWYGTDKGTTTVGEVVAIIEAAAKGERLCSIGS